MLADHLIHEHPVDFVAPAFIDHHPFEHDDYLDVDYDDFGYPIIHHPLDGHLMLHDEIDFYLNTDPHHMTLEQLGFFKKLGRSIKKTASSATRKVSNTAKKASRGVSRTAKRAGRSGKDWWRKNTYKVKKGINIANKVTGYTNKFMSYGGAYMCGPYAGACKTGAKAAHMATTAANYAAQKYIKLIQLQQQLADEAADMGLVY